MSLDILKILNNRIKHVNTRIIEIEKEYKSIQSIGLNTISNENLNMLKDIKVEYDLLKDEKGNLQLILNAYNKLSKNLSVEGIVKVIFETRNQLKMLYELTDIDTVQWGQDCDMQIHEKTRLYYAVQAVDDLIFKLGLEDNENNFEINDIDNIDIDELENKIEEENNK